ncbi:protein NRT1/ PTR FAMILY 8.2-like [Salvia divinorum]|uniref:Protein NRT1/ PTR FAMILY 8.2-like n=1 Tax=Salvia divinorum TaxID=28513 RepID=A0ABD1G8G1_SALDI
MEVQARQRSIRVISETNIEYSTLVTNGCVDYKGRIASKQSTGGWKASPFIIVNEVAERLAFFAVAVNMVGYLVREMHQPFPDAATHVTDWIGAAYVLTLFGAFLADAYLGRFKTIIIFSAIYALGMVLLTLSATIDTMRPPRCTRRPCVPSTTNQKAFLYCALVLIALENGGIKPYVSSFGADQFDESVTSEAQKKYAFFNWFFFAINMGALLGITLMVYIQDEFDWAWGFGVPTAAMITSVVILAAGFMRGIGAVTEADDLYEVKTKESDIFGARKLNHTKQYRFLDKAAIITDQDSDKTNRWKICTVTQVEEFKSHVRILPIWASTITLAISFAQLSTYFIIQAGSLNALLIVPLYEKLAVPFLRHGTGHPRGLTSLQRMGVGLFVSILAMASAALVETKRRGHAPQKINIFWLFPQFFLIGLAEVFTYVGQLEFFYDEATDGTRSISSAMFVSEIGIGSWLSTAVVKATEGATGRGGGRGSVRDESAAVELGAETRSGGGDDDGSKAEFQSVVI